MSKPSTLGDTAKAAPTIGDFVADRVKLEDIPATLHAVCVFDPDMGRSRIGFSYSIDEYDSVQVKVYTDPDDTFPKVTLKRDEAKASRIAGGRRVKFEWQLDDTRLVTMTAPQATPATALTSVVVTTDNGE